MNGKKLYITGYELWLQNPNHMSGSNVVNPLAPDISLRWWHSVAFFMQGSFTFRSFGTHIRRLILAPKSW